MAASISWLDHDSKARERAMRLLSFFNEKEARDELGISAIRDSISDQLFPGTSTIQTRLRYMFFIPWLFTQLEERDTAASSFAAEARKMEIDLSGAISPDSDGGVIGSDAGADLKRLPSSVYWAGLGNWGLRKYANGREQYFQQIGRIVAKRRVQRKRQHELDQDDLAIGQTWHPGLLKLIPEGFPSVAGLQLTHDESAFLLDRWRQAQPHSLMTWLALDAAKHGMIDKAEFIWLHRRYGDFPERLRKLVDQAKLFAALVRGAALLYNLQLAELLGNDKWVSNHTSALDEWIDQDLPKLAQWSPDTMWPQVKGHGHLITEKTEIFVHAWHRIATASGDALALSGKARSLIQSRERALKGPRSRFANRNALNQWGGASGIRRLEYRWPIAQHFLEEWFKGMHA